MCGINLYYVKKTTCESEIFTLANKSRHRGPDLTTMKVIDCDLDTHKLIMVFHRLAINDLLNGNQPFVDDEQKIFVMCNGEIYNWKELASKYDVKCKSHSDCEIILHLYKKIGFDKLIEELDGYFGLTVIDLNLWKLFVSRDYLGVRSLFMGSNENEYGFSSELKSLHPYFNQIEQFPHGNYLEVELLQGQKKFKTYRTLEELSYPMISNEEQILNNIRESLTTAVTQRMLCDSTSMIGSLASGGVDSTIVTTILASLYDNPKDLHTFCIGLEGSLDVHYSKILAEHIGTNHHIYTVTEQELLEFIPQVIYQIGSWDTTTVRASTLMYLLTKKIKKDYPHLKVLFSSEISDEVCGSYMYFRNAPSKEDFQNETIRLLNNLRTSDLLRGDASISGSSFEGRFPFASKDVIKSILTADSELKVHQKFGVEKYLLRKAFDFKVGNREFIPKELLWRTKVAFSDSYSSKKKKVFYQLIEDHVNSLISDEEFEKERMNYSHCPPMTKEALWYRRIFKEKYEGMDKVIPYYWMPKWVGENVVNPSAVVLNMYDPTK